MSFREWVELRVGDLCDISSSKRIYSREYVEAGIPFYRSKEIIKKYNKQALDNVLYISEERFKEIDEKYGSPDKGDMLLTSVGTLGVPYIVQEGEKFYFKDGNLTWFKNFSDKLSSNFLYYWVQSPLGKEELKKITIGSTQQALTIESLKKMKIKLPEREEQNCIVNILSTLDEKIEINNKINKTLEEMAQTIFKHWFVDFEFPNENGEPYKSSGGEMTHSKLGMIPKGWEVTKLNELANLTMGLSPKSSTYNTDGIGTPLLNGAADFENGLINAKKYTTNPKRICKKNDLVFCIRATIGNITFADKEYCLGRGVASVTPKDNIYTGILYYSLLSSMNKLIKNATGSVIIGLSKPDINNIKIILPDNQILKTFSDITKSILQKKYENNVENKILINIRDTFLTKLMSGEIRIPLNN